MFIHGFIAPFSTICVVITVSSTAHNEHRLKHSQEQKIPDNTKCMLGSILQVLPNTKSTLESISYPCKASPLYSWVLGDPPSLPKHVLILHCI